MATTSATAIAAAAQKVQEDAENLAAPLVVSGATSTEAETAMTNLCGWLDSNESAINNCFPTQLKANGTLQQKAEFLLYAVKAKAGLPL
jgi:hypothetical protein